jgi:hypothetical protein
MKTLALAAGLTLILSTSARGAMTYWFETENGGAGHFSYDSTLGQLQGSYVGSLVPGAPLAPIVEAELGASANLPANYTWALDSSGAHFALLLDAYAVTVEVPNFASLLIGDDLRSDLTLSDIGMARVDTAFGVIDFGGGPSSLPLPGVCPDEADLTSCPPFAFPYVDDAYGHFAIVSLVPEASTGFVFVWPLSLLGLLAVRARRVV